MKEKTKITIGSLTFNTKSEVFSFFQKILHAYRPGESLKDEDFQHVWALYCQKKSERKFQKIDRIVVNQHPGYKKIKCFQFEVDGQFYPISFRHCLNGKPLDFTKFSMACRQAVAHGLREFKKERFKSRPVRCAVTNEIVEWDECHVDHKAPLTFSVIVKSFLVANQVNFEDIEYISDDHKVCFSDQHLAQRFVEFHRGMAVLRIVSAKQNHKLSAVARIKPTKKDGKLS